MSRRLCRNCKEPLAVDQDICQVCGTRNPLVVPWYTWVLGPIIVLALGWLLIDFEALKQVVGID